ncbi:Hypothetical Protein FCC1311_047012 [Hondaea fermentalgiana]|uniref:Tyrosine specific protein phosphatases domain-containing protein n=1 Tax=Hondaea fermentalgiana TaxID=2315210 RepID=A0A2R5GFE1_9STRA|nr:Hypothetical Protein FCC1311_047012 [Hondaea fermentalgiana]|eukprot:GBG28478.1 Hypothetical Protein FCC1311_047012 [Hondaea fermentalgiana]
MPLSQETGLSVVFPVIAVRAHAQRAAADWVRETVRAVVAVVVKARTKRFGGKVQLACGAAALDPHPNTAAAAAAAKNNDDNEALPPPLAVAVKPSIAMAATDRAPSDEQVETIEKEEHKSNEEDGDAESERESEERESAMRAKVLRKRRLMTIEAVSNNREFWLGPTKESNWVIPGKLLVGAYPLIQVMFPYMEDAAALSGLDGLRLFKLPIVDLQCTSDANVLALAVDLVQLIASGGHEVVYMHCWGGHGRTGTLVAVMLSLYYGIDAEEALLRTQLYHDIRRTKLEVRSPQTKEQCAQVRRILASTEACEARRRLMRLSVPRPTGSLFEVDWRRAALGLDDDDEEEDEEEVCVSCADVGESSLGVLETKTDGTLDETALGYTEDDLQLELKDNTTTTSQLVAQAKTPEMALLERGASGDSSKGATSRGHDDDDQNGDKGEATGSADFQAGPMDVESKDDENGSTLFASAFAKTCRMNEEKKWDDVASEECDDDEEEEDDDDEEEEEDDEEDEDEEEEEEEEDEEEEEKDGEEKLEVHPGAILTALPSPALGSPWGAGSLLVSPVSATSFSTAATNEMKLDTPVFGDMNTMATTTPPHPTTTTSMTPATEEDEAETPRSFEAMVCGPKASAASAAAIASAPGSAGSKARQRKRKPKLLSPKFRRTLRLASSSSSSGGDGSERIGQGLPMRPRPPDAASADRGSGARRRGPSPRQKLAAFHPVSF